MGITFDTEKFGVSFLDIVNKRIGPRTDALGYTPIFSTHDEVRPIFNDKTSFVIKKVFEHGGYIAGGFAADFARMLHSIEPLDRITLCDTREFPTRNFIPEARYETLRMGVTIDVRHYELKTPPFEAECDWRVFAHNKIDIDVFFETEEDANHCLDEVFEAFDDRMITKSGRYATDVLCFSPDKKTAQCVQFVTKFSGPPREHVAESFDILNAMCIIKNDCMYVPRGFYELCDAQKINIVRLRGEYAVNRVFKWITKHEFSRGIDESSMNNLDALIEGVLREIEDDAYEFRSAEDKLQLKKNVRKLHHIVSNIKGDGLKDVSAATLMHLSAYPDDAYGTLFNGALDALARRIDCDDI